MIATAGIPTLPPRFESGVADAVTRSRHLAVPVLLTHAEVLAFTPNPLAFLAASAGALGHGVYWSQQDIGTTFAGAGVACDITADGPGRFGAVTSSLRELRHRVISTGERVRIPLLGGFAFDDYPAESPVWRGFPAASLAAPGVLLQIEGGTATLRVTLLIDAGDERSDVIARFRELHDRARHWLRAAGVDGPTPRELIGESIPDPMSWQSAVATAVSIINHGTIEKVVLAREERIRASSPLSALAALRRLRDTRSGSTQFGFQAGGSWFIGATPERLVRLGLGHVDVTCLAGSIAIGSSADDRARLAKALLASQKDREEHEIVVRSTMAALQEVCEHVSRLPGTPRLAQARSVQHLESPLTAELPRPGHILDLVERLHPTPAVGGYPRDRALALMRELEEIERGWYAGPVGWADLEGDGEFAVAIRSAVVSGQSASLFAGCGIVAESDPAAEFEETRLKLRPMFSALGAS